MSVGTIGEMDLLPGNEKEDLVCCFEKKDLPMKDVIIGTNIGEMAGVAFSELCKCYGHKIFERSRRIVQIAYSPQTGVCFEKVEPPRLRELISECCQFSDAEGKPKLPPEYIANTILCWPSFQGLTSIQGVTQAPIVRSDGSITAKIGLDKRTGYYYSGDTCQEIGEIVQTDYTKDLALQYVQKLKDLIKDFPFASDIDRSSLLSAWLTPIAKPAYKGNTPLFLIEANVLGTGKTKLLKLLGIMLDGDIPPILPKPESKEEERKTLTGIMLDGPLCAMFDDYNEIGSKALDALLTGGKIKERILGASDLKTFVNNTIFYFTANNPSIACDTSRRIKNIRLESPLENPEERKDFDRPLIESFVREHRYEYLQCLVGIVSAFLKAKPKIVAVQTENKTEEEIVLKPWGSFEEWSYIVRACLVWLGEPDPYENHSEFKSNSDTSKSSLELFIDGWSEMLLANQIDDATSGEVSGFLFNENHDQPTKYPLLRAAISEYGRKPTPRDIGVILKGGHGRVIGGKKISYRGNSSRRRWFVESINTPQEEKQEEDSIIIE